MKKLTNLIVVILIGIFIFYLVPELSNGMSKDDGKDFAILCALVFNSFYSICTGFTLTKLNGFKWYYTIIIGLLFVPAAFLEYNKSTSIYSILYMLEVMIGSSIYIGYKNK